nr:uncharacterized protein LOC111511613 [Leptinotarsa decemlineata]
MNKILTVFAFIAVLQFVNCQDNRLANCMHKLKSEISSLQSRKTVPKCMNGEKLAKVLESSKNLKEIIEEITKSCKEEGLSKCFSSFRQLLLQNQDSIKSDSSKFLSDLMELFTPCLGDLQKNLSTMDDFIKKGCPDE